jgi:uncharacterized membrane protein (UPF0127 family)
MGKSSVVALGAVLFVALVGCHRTVDEPSARAAPSAIAPEESRTEAPSDSSATTAALAGRCVYPTPETGPPHVDPAPPGKCPADPSPGYTLATSTMELPDATKGKTHLVVELARSPGDNERGLMYRTSMPEDHGMWFDDSERRVHTFWMHNTCIPLDLLFLDEDGLIVGIVENAPTLDDHVVSVPCPSSYVLEVNAGWSRRHGVRAGQRAIIPPRA